MMWSVQPALHHLFRRTPYFSLNRITLSHKNLLQNYTTIAAFARAQQPTVQLAPVLKSNAYGHGLVPVAQTIALANPPFLVVDSIPEAIAIRKANVHIPVLIMGYTDPRNFMSWQLPFHHVLLDLKTAEVIARYQPSIPLHLKVDTGMNRQGVRWDELPEFLAALKRWPQLHVVGVCSHLADADSPTGRKATAKQLRRFLITCQQVAAAGHHIQWRHLANTAGSLTVSHPDINMIRLGIGLYGISPFSGSNQVIHDTNLNLRPVLQFESTLVQVKKVMKGERVGYNGTFTAQKNMRIGILPVGYNDGVDRRLSNNGVVTIDGVPCPILGRVSMNITTIDLSLVPTPTVGQRVVVISRDSTAPNAITALAKLCQTIPYELLVHLTPTTRREFMDEHL